MTREATTFSIMAYATGLRLLAAVCCFTIILSPLGVFFWWMARRKEKAKERREAALEEIAENTNPD